MDEQLISGPGICQATARLVVKATKPVIEVGATHDVVSRILRTVHHANRHGDLTDFIAVGFTAWVKGYDCYLPGHEIELVGSEKSLARLQSLEVYQQLQQRFMIAPARIFEIEREAGEFGVAYVRDRIGEKYTEAGIQRMKRRAERRAQHIAEKRPAFAEMTVTEAKARISFEGPLFRLNISGKPLKVREVVGDQGTGELKVSTYGFSAPSQLAVLPIYPASALALRNAA